MSFSSQALIVALIFDTEAAMLPKIGIAGTGSYLPDAVITNNDLAQLIREKDGAWATEKLGIEGRRFMTPLDENGHPTTPVDELDMAERAAREAMADAGLTPTEVHGLWFISCTQTDARRHFSRSAFELHKRLGLPAEAVALEMDAGCGGAVQALGLGADMLRGNGRDSLLLVASSGPSAYYGDWESYVASKTWLSMFIFGDGAGAVLLRKSEGILSNSEVIASYQGVDPTQPLMEYANRGNGRRQMYIIDGRAVATSFRVYARRALEGLQKKHPFDVDTVARFYFHQVNGRVLTKFVEEMNIPKEKVGMHVDRYGNIAAAATLVLLDEDRKAGLVQDGDLVVFCAVGAGAQYGAALVRL